MTRTLTLAALLLLGCTAPRSASPSIAHPVDSAPSGAPLVVAPVTAVASGVPPSPALVAAPRYTGTATFYCSDGRDGSPISRCTRGYGPDDLVAAIDRKDTTFRKGDRVTVRFGRKHVTVTIVDVCACADRRVIDLTSGAFSRLAPLGMGVLSVTVELAGASPTLPATSTED